MRDRDVRARLLVDAGDLLLVATSTIRDVRAADGEIVGEALDRPTVEVIERAVWA